MHCDFELSKTLNEHGFSEYCVMVYLKHSENQISLKNRFSDDAQKFPEIIDAPTFEQVNEWFRLKHNVEISSIPSEVVGKWRCNIYDLTDHHIICNVGGGKLYDSKYDALEAGIKKMIEHI